jgi:hypothetical protein
MAASKYLFVWTCSRCDYIENTVAGPIRIEPLPDILKSKIETRWCNKCNGIRRCFIGKGHFFIPGEEPDCKAPYWKYKNLEEIKSEIFKTNEEINKIENKKKSQIFFSLSENFKTLKNLYAKVQELNLNAKQYSESLNICSDLSKNANNFYDKIKPVPKCLTCGSENISNVEWNRDKHKCGGSFIRNNGDIRFTVTEYELIQYNENGESIHSMMPVT